MDPETAILESGAAAICEACASGEALAWYALGPACSRNSRSSAEPAAARDWAEAAFACYMREASTLSTPSREGCEVLAFGNLVQFALRFGAPAGISIRDADFPGVAECIERVRQWLVARVTKFSSPTELREALVKGDAEQRLDAVLLRESLEVGGALWRHGLLQDPEGWFEASHLDANP